MKRVFLSLIMVLAYASVTFAGNITPDGMNQGDLVNHLIESQFKELNRNVTTKAIAMNASDKSHISIVTAGSVTSNGVFYTVAAATGTNDILLTASQQTVSTIKLYLFVYDAANATTEVLVGASGDTSPENIAIAAGHTPMAYAKVVTDATHTFTLGTTAFDAAGITTTFYNVSALPFKNNALSE